MITIFNINNKVKWLVVITLLISIIPVLNLSATSGGYDNSQFVSELTSEERTEKELQEKKDDFEYYQGTISNRTGYQNFNGIEHWENEQQYNKTEKQMYDKMDTNSDYTQAQKDEYYNLVLGDATTNGVMDQVYEFTTEMYDARDSDKIYDTSDAIEIINKFENPKYTVNNVDFINDFSMLLYDLEDAIAPANTSSLTEEEIDQLKTKNVIFTSQFNGLLKKFEVFSQPRLKLSKRLLHTPVIYNLACLVGVGVLFAVRFKVVKLQQEYAWGAFKPLTFIVIPVVALVFVGVYVMLFGSNRPDASTSYTMYLDGQQVQQNERIYLEETREDMLYLVAEDGAGNVSATQIPITVTDDLTRKASTSTDLPVITQGGTEGATFSAKNGNELVFYQTPDDEYAYKTLGEGLVGLDISANDKVEYMENTVEFATTRRRNEFILPWPVPVIFPALLAGTMFFMFILMPGPMVKMYLDELYTINKFCGFLSYNMAYRSNARVLIEETLQSLDACKFAEDFAIIFFEKDRAMVDKIHDISQIYSYKFFEMYLGIVNIIFDEGVSDSTLKSLAIIQQFGDEYYNQADMFFRSKKAARGSVMMIIAVSMAIPILVRKNVTDLFILYVNTSGGYTMTCSVYLIWLALICLIFNMYKDNKIVRKEGRYV